MELLEIFQNLKALTSTKDKKEFLEKQKNTPVDDYLCTLLDLNLNPHKMFNIRAIPNYSLNLTNNSGKTNYKNFIKLTYKLLNRELTGNAAKDAVKEFFENSCAEDIELYEPIIMKEAIGVGAKTVNKVWPKLIPEFRLLLAPNELPIITQVKYPIYIEPKIDGYRCVYIRGNLWSRAGKAFANKNLPSYFSSLYNLDNHVLDGELHAEGLTFNDLQVILNSYHAPLPNSLKYTIYDAMTIEDWIARKCLKPRNERINLFRSLLNGVVADYSKVIDIPIDLVDTAKEAIDLYKYYLKQGYEGAIMKAPDGLYKWKRTTLKSGEIMKLKPFKSIDLEIVGVYAGEGEREGIMAGGVTVNHKGVEVRCSSGFDHETLTDLMKNPSKYIGKTIEIRYLEETKDNSLRHPSFKRWREEKD